MATITLIREKASSFLALAGATLLFASLAVLVGAFLLGGPWWVFGWAAFVFWLGCLLCADFCEEVGNREAAYGLWMSMNIILCFIGIPLGMLWLAAN